MLIVFKDSPGGVKSYNENLIKYLTESGVKFGELRYSFIDTYEPLKIEQTDNKYHVQIPRFISRKEVFKGLNFVFRKHDLILCSDGFELEVIDYCKIESKVVFVLHGDLQHYRNVLTERCGIIDRVFCVSASLMDIYSKDFPALNFSVAYPLIEDYLAQPYSSSSASLKSFFAGRFVWLKGADILNELIAKLQEGLKIDISLYVPDCESDETLLQSIPAGINIVFGLSNADLLSRMNQYDFLLFPSRSEGFGIVVVEAMKRGVVPFVVDEALGPKDVIDHGKNGYSFAADMFAENAASEIQSFDADRTKLFEMKIAAQVSSHQKFLFSEVGAAALQKLKQIEMRQPKRFSKPALSFWETYLPFSIYRHLHYLRSKLSQMWQRNFSIIV